MRSMSPCRRRRRRSYVIRPGVNWLGFCPSSGARCSRRSWCLNVPWSEEEQEQDMQESLNARVGEAQRRRTLVVQADGPLHFLEGSFANETVVTDALDVEQTSVGREADHTQFFEIFDASANGEVTGIVDCRFGSEGLSLFVVLLDTRFLVVDVQRGNHAVGDDAGTESAWCAPAYLAVEHQAHLAGPADIEVLTDHPLEEDAPGHRLIEHLGERELGLQNGELVA